MRFGSLKDKVALVTGGAKGIGKGLARACLQEGARVIITNLHEDQGRATQKELGDLGRIRSEPCDSTERDQVESLVNDIIQEEGSLDLVFSNAGAGDQHRVLSAQPEEIDRIFSTNFRSAVNLAQCCVPRMVEQGSGGHLMFTGSEHSVSLPKGNETLGFSFYGATKHAMLIMAEWLRNDLLDTEVSASVLMPGPVLTESVINTFEMLEREPDNPDLRAIFSKDVEGLLRERAITTDQCAAIALKGMRAGLFYIPTQPHIFDDIESRFGELKASFEALNLK